MILLPLVNVVQDSAAQSARLLHLCLDLFTSLKATIIYFLRTVLMGFWGFGVLGLEGKFFRIT